MSKLKEIISKLFPEIKNMSDVIRFVKFLTNDLEINFHPDTDFNDYATNTGEPLFTEAEQELLNKLLLHCIYACEENGTDIYEVTLQEFNRKQWGIM